MRAPGMDDNIVAKQRMLNRCGMSDMAIPADACTRSDCGACGDDRTGPDFGTRRDDGIGLDDNTLLEPCGGVNWPRCRRCRTRR
jgi:ribosomal protein S27AE